MGGLAEAADGAVADEFLPGTGRAGFRLELADFGRWRCTYRNIAPQSPAADEPHGRAHDAVAHDEHRHRRTADDVDLGRAFRACGDTADIAADQCVERGNHLLLGNADEDDRFLVMDQLEAAQHTLRVDAGEDVDRLARIAGRAGEIGIEVSVAGENFASPDRGDRWFTYRLAEAVSTGKEIRWLCFRQVLR